MRSMWAGPMTLGMVTIPVKLYAATEQHGVVFRQVHRADGGRISFRRVCGVCGEEVDYADVARGYELPTGEVVVLTDEDLAGLPFPAGPGIEIVQFAPARQVDPLFLARSYYLEPEPAGARGYVLLSMTLERSDMVAVARAAIRQRAELATIRAKDDVLVLDTLLWPDEVRAPDFAFLREDMDIPARELGLIRSVVTAMTADFDPSVPRDGLRDALAELVAAKAAGRDVVRPGGGQQVSGRIADLADALAETLADIRTDGWAQA
jgi:DNA end-binding protein Ku